MSEVTALKKRYCTVAMYSEQIGEFVRYTIDFENSILGVKNKTQVIGEEEALKVFNSFALAI